MEIKYQDLKVCDRATFIKFVENLRSDLRDDGSSWENNTLDNFLEALSRYTEDIQGYYDYTEQKINADQPSWQLFADILKGATIYE